LNKVKPLFKANKLIIYPLDGVIDEIVDLIGGKTRAVTHLKVTYRIVDIETGQYIDAVGFGNGADSQDKGAGKASTYSFKNVLSKTFMLFSGEDTDNDHSHDLDEEDKPVVKGKSTPPEHKNTPQGNTGATNGAISLQDAKQHIMTGGKHKGETMQHVYETDKSYLVWASTKTEYADTSDNALIVLSQGGQS